MFGLSVLFFIAYSNLLGVDMMGSLPRRTFRRNMTLWTIGRKGIARAGGGGPQVVSERQRLTTFLSEDLFCSVPETLAPCTEGAMLLIIAGLVLGGSFATLMCL